MQAPEPVAQIAPPPLEPTLRLTRRQKAAVIVRLLLNEGAEVPIASLPEDMQADLTRQIGAMGYVDRATLAATAREFADELDKIGLSFPRGLSRALDVLDGRLSRKTADQLRRDSASGPGSDPWERIRALEVEALRPFMEDESIEVAAVILSKIDVPRAAELLGLLPGELARRITYAVSLTEGVTPDAVERIGRSIVTQIDARPDRAFASGPEARVGAMLNISPAAMRDDVLTGLDQADRAFADRVRKAIFTFAHIPARVAPRDMPKLTRAMDQDALVRALASAQATGLEEAAEFILSNISGRLADQLREDMADAGEPSETDGEAAMNLVIATLRGLEDEGELRLAPPPED